MKQYCKKTKTKPSSYELIHHFVTVIEFHYFKTFQLFIYPETISYYHLTVLSYILPKCIDRDAL